MKIALKQRAAAQIAANTAPALKTTKVGGIRIRYVDSTAKNFGAQFVAAFGHATSNLGGKSGPGKAKKTVGKKHPAKKPITKSIGKKA